MLASVNLLVAPSCLLNMKEPCNLSTWKMKQDDLELQVSLAISNSI